MRNIRSIRLCLVFILDETTQILISKHVLRIFVIRCFTEEV